MKKHFTISMLFLILGLTVFVSPAHTKQIMAHYMTFNQGDGTIFGMLISRKGVKYSLQENNVKRSILFRRKETPSSLYILMPRQKRAQKISRDDLKKTRMRLQRQVQQMRNSLKNLPPKQKKRMEQRLDKQSTLLSNEVETPEFMEEESDTWMGLPAKKGHLKNGSDSPIEVILLNESPLDLSLPEEQSFKSFNKLLVQWSTITNFSAGQKSGGKSVQNRLGELYLRLGKYTSTSGKTIKLTNWGSRQVKSSVFDVPDDYQVRPLSKLLRSKSSPSR
ncbi:MAG: hypothetical protein ABEJ65_09520 [bacterium]